MKTLFLLFSLTLSMIQPLQASSWISVAIPGVAVVQDDTNAVYTIQGRLSGKISGQLLGISLPIRFLPALGYDQTSMEVQGLNTTEAASIVKTELYNLIFDFSSKNAKLYVGLGKGSSRFYCKAASCSSIITSTGPSKQVFLDMGIPLGKVSDLHLSLHQVQIEIPITNGVQSHKLNLSSFLVSIGLRYGF